MKTNYLKELADDEKDYSKNLRRGVGLFKNLKGQRNLSKVKNYIFKHGDLMGELNEEEFPFLLDGDASMTVINLKGEVVNFIVEPESESSYHITMHTKEFRIIFIMALNKDTGFVNNNPTVNKETRAYFVRNGINGNELMINAENTVGKMIAIIAEKNRRLSFTWPGGFLMQGTSTARRVKASLISTRHKNMLVTCDAYPYFYDVDFRKINEDMGTE